MDPLVTIAIPSYNYGRYVREAICSALAQTHRNIEVLVVDDASTDDSLEVIRSVRDERVRLVVHPRNIGIGPNHNAALGLARGAFVTLLAADDVLLPTCVQDGLAFRREHPEIEVTYATVGIMDADGAVLRYFDHPGFNGARSYAGRNELAHLLLRGNYIYAPTVLFPTAFFHECGLLDESLGIHTFYEYYLRMAAARKRFGFSSKPQALVRLHGTNYAGSEHFERTAGQLLELCDIFERYTQPASHSQLAGYGTELLAGLGHQVERIRTSLPDRFEALRPQLEPRIQKAAKNIACVPAISPAVAKGEPLISVIIPFAGRIGPLTRALATLDGRYPRWEAIVVVDQAPDPSGLIDRMNLGDRVRVVCTSRRNGGAGEVRNLGLSGVNGEIVAYLDEDNRFEVGYMQALAQAFTDPSVMVTVGKTRIAVVSENGEVRHVRDSDLGAPGGRVSLVSNRVPLNAVAHRRSCLSVSGSFDGRVLLLEDWEFLIRLNAAFAFTPLPAVAACLLCLDIGLQGHEIYGRRTSAEWSQFATIVQDVYRTYPVQTESERTARSAYANSLQAIIQNGINSAGDTERIMAFMEALSGVYIVDRDGIVIS